MGETSLLDYLLDRSEQVGRTIEEILPRKLTPEWVTSVLGRSTYDVDLATLEASISVPVWDFLDRGGKRWRPMLLLTCAEAVSGSPERALPLVPLIELVHNGTLVHDDLEDDSDLRRGKACLHKLYGVDVATNVGSAMYFLPLVILFGKRAPYDDAERLRIYDLSIQELLRCHCGQAIDIAWHNGARSRITESEYLQMCAYKTGVLARLAARLGAFVAGGTEEQGAALGTFGETLGVAFQIQDDILNLIGTKFAEGKGRGEDIHEGKRTLLVWYALEHASEANARQLTDILASHPVDQATIDTAISIIESTGAVDYARRKAHDLIEKSWARIDPLLDPSSAKDRLRSFADFVVKRDL